MPSLSKIWTSRKSNNPYANPYHPNHNPIPTGRSANTTTASTIPRSQSVPIVPPRPASPRGSRDFLAEARELAGRDPVTGQRQQPTRTAGEAGIQVMNQGRSNASVARGEGGAVTTEQSAYLHRVLQSRQRMGGRYDLFVQDCIAQRDAQERIVKARGGIEYYAPERQMNEFYAGGVRD